MTNNTSALQGQLVYPWNPFQDLASNDIKGEVHHIPASPSGSIIIPRCSPLFSRNVKVKQLDSSRELSLEAGDYSFVFPFGNFIGKYNRLVYGGIVINNVTTPINIELDYSTIGGDFVLDEIKYLEAVANAQIAPRREDWDKIINLPTEWPVDPHPHPASDTYNYQDMITVMRSYIDAMSGTENPLAVQQLLEEHLKANLQQAHKGDLQSLGVTNLEDWRMATVADLQGSSTELLVNVNVLKEAIRGFAQGTWK